MSLDDQNVVTTDDQNLNMNNVIFNVVDTDKLSHVVENEKLKLLSIHDWNGEKDNVIIDDEFMLIRAQK